jgi:hypothetical protein
MDGRDKPGHDDEGLCPSLSIVMRGLDPRIHDGWPRCLFLRPTLWVGLMDYRVKPGNDG